MNFKKYNKIRKVLLAILPGIIVAGLIFGANIYYDLDVGKIIVNEVQRVTQRLEVASDLIVSGNATTTNIYPSADIQYVLGSPTYRWANIFAATGTFGGTITIGTNTIQGSATTTLFTTGNANQLVLGANGNVGIGTATPSQKLDVQGGNINISGSLMTGGVARIDSSGNLINIGNITLSGTISGTYTIGGTPTLASSLTGSGSPNITGIGLLSATNLTISGTATTTNLNVTGLTNLATTTISTQLSVPLITSPSTLTIFPSGNATTTITGPVILASQTGNVGIGTTGPAYKLDVSGIGRFTSNLRVGGLIDVGDAGQFEIQKLADRVRIDIAGGALPGGYEFRVNNNPIVKFTTSGNVGIGTTGPAYKLDVEGDIRANASLTFSTSTPVDITKLRSIISLDATNRIPFKVTIGYPGHSSQDNFYWSGTGDLILRGWGGQPIRLGTYNNGEIVYIGSQGGILGLYMSQGKISATYGITVGSSYSALNPPTNGMIVEGNVGIGTTAPATRLHVVGQTRIENNAANIQFVGSNHVYQEFYPQGVSTGRFAWIGFGSAGTEILTIMNQRASRLDLGTNNAVWVSINPSGNVGIGTTAPSSRLTIAAGATNGEFAIGNFNAKVIDDMEDVTDWSSSDTTSTTISLESTNVKVGNYALKISTTVSNSNGDTVTKTFSPTENWTTFGKLGFWIRASYTTTSTDATTSQIISIQFHDTGGNTQTRNITIKEFDQWQYEEWDISGVASTDRDAVDWIRFRIDNDYGSPVFYIDQIRLYSSTERTGEIFVDKSGSLVIMGRNTTEIYAPNSSSGQLPGLKVGPTVTEVNQPLSVNVGGDVGLSYDLVFLNTGLSSITSEGGLQILAGAPYRIANLTLGTQYNPGARDSGTSSGGNTATTLNDTTKSWATSTWVGGAVRITAGTGAGQVRAICANTRTQITVCDSWTTIPDTTSKYEIIGMPTGGDVIVDIGGANFASGGFKIFGADEGGAVFRVSPTGDVEIGSSGGWGEGKLIVKGGIVLRGGNLQANKLPAPTGLNSTTQNSGGSLSGAVATYYYKVTAINGDGTETTPSATRAQSLTPLSAPTPSLTVNTTGTTYYAYRVAVYTSNGTSTPSAAVTTDIGADPPNNTISWSAVAGASGYILFRQKATTTADWEWQDMGTSTSFTDTLSTWTATTTLPTVNNARTNTNIITLSWNVVPGAKGYKVYRGTDDVWGNADDRLVDNGVIFTNQVVDDGVGDSPSQVSPPTTNTTGGDLTVQGYITMANSTYQTLVTRVKAGAPTEPDANGALVVDSANGRLYFRYGDTWHYVVQTAGFEIPADEIYDPITGQLISEGDFVLGWINEIKSDSARHGLWVRFDTVKDKIFSEFKEKIKNEFKFSIDDSGYLVVEKIKAKEIQAEKICLDDICITKEELRQLLESRNNEGGSMNGGGSGGTNQETTTTQELTTTTTEPTNQ